MRRLGLSAFRARPGLPGGTRKDASLGEHFHPPLPKRGRLLMEQVTFATELLVINSNVSTWNSPWLSECRISEIDGIAFPSMSLHCMWGCGNHPFEVHISCISPSVSTSMVILGEEPTAGEQRPRKQSMEPVLVVVLLVTALRRDRRIQKAWAANLKGK